MGKKKEAEINRDTIESEIRELVSKLDTPTSDVGDWKIVKIYEARLHNLPDSYDYEELARERQAIRDRINELQQLLEGAE